MTKKSSALQPTGKSGAKKPAARKTSNDRTNKTGKARTTISIKAGSHLLLLARILLQKSSTLLLHQVIKTKPSLNRYSM